MSTRNVVISDGSSIDQIERDRLPDHSGAAGSSYAQRQKRAGLPWQAWLGLFVGVFSILAYLIYRFVQWLSDVSNETSWLDVYLVALIKSALFLAPVAVIVLCCYWLYQKAAAARIVRLQNNMPIDRRHIERDDWQPAAIASLGAFYDVQGEWARHSTYRS